jgi:anti-sigma regulatory factor (Ser/Thr protein kinase)
MNATAPARTAELHQRRVRLARQPVAAGQARGHVRAALRSWQVPVDPDVATLLTSDVVTNAILHGAGPSVTVAIRCSRGQLRVDVYDSARSLPVPAETPDEDGAGPELVLVARLADDWGAPCTSRSRSTGSQRGSEGRLLPKRHGRYRSDRRVNVKVVG